MPTQQLYSLSAFPNSREGYRVHPTASVNQSSYSVQDKALAASLPKHGGNVLLRTYVLEGLACASAVAWLAFVAVPAISGGFFPLAAERCFTACLHMYLHLLYNLRHDGAPL